VTLKGLTGLEVTPEGKRIQRYLNGAGKLFKDHDTLTAELAVPCAMEIEFDDN